MKLSLAWLDSYFTTKPDWNVVFDKLIMAGIEIEDIIDTATDKIVEFKITPNRGDCLSVHGILREIAAVTEYKPDILQINDRIIKEYTRIAKQQLPHQIEVQIDTPDFCSEYISLTIQNINNNVVLPSYITTRLLASGYRSVSAVVDITNYVMLEIGQPLHAFDLDHVGNKLYIRKVSSNVAPDGYSTETINLLDGTKATLTPNTLVICDSTNRPTAIAGVMGGEHSQVSPLTVNIVLESAIFTQEVIAGIARKYGVNSDSAYRFERGVDPELTQSAIMYAAYLIHEYCGGKIGSLNSVMSKERETRILSVSLHQINKLIGVEIQASIIVDILNRLGFKVPAMIAEVITVIIPSFRFDIVIKEDLIEEIARIYGYNNIPPILPCVPHMLSHIQDDWQQMNGFKSQLVDLGYHEIINYAFLEEKLAKLFPVIKELHNKEINCTDNLIKLQNPIANWNVMRNNLFVDLIKTLQYNINRGIKSTRLFEVGRVFYGTDEASQPLKIAGLIFGNYSVGSSYLNVKREVDFFDIKHDIQMLLSGYKNINFVATTNYSGMHPGICATMWLDSVLIGVVGQLHPSIGYEFDLAQLPYLFELDLDVLQNNIRANMIRSANMGITVPYKFPKVERDLAVVISATIPASDVIVAINKDNVPYLIDIKIFDVYQGSNVPDKMKSVAINFIFQANKTLTEAEINVSLDMIKSILANKFDAKLR